MSTNRIYCAALLLLLCTLNAQAGPRSLEQIRQIATSFIRSQQAFKDKAPALTLATPLEAKSKNGTTVPAAYHVLNIETGGYVIVSGDDQFKAILGYSHTGTFDTGTLPDGLSYWLQFLSEEMAAAQTAVPMADPAAASTPLTDIEPLLHSNWMQQYPLNAQVPIAYTANYPIPQMNEQYNLQYQGHASTGCVALGMGQLMNYWKYPSKGQGGIYKNTSNKGSDGKDTIISVNFSEQTYDWDLILDSYDWYVYANGTVKYPFTDAQAQEAAKLCYHAGVAVDMKWNDGGSGSSSAVNGKALAAFINNFGYNKYAYMQQRNPLSPGTFRRLLWNELKEGRPVMYSGSSSRGGHFFVIDGYQASTDSYHINWGWQGQYNGYYALSALTPGIETGYAVGDYNYHQAAIIGIQPTEIFFEYTPAISAQTFSVDKTTVQRGNEQTLVRVSEITNDDPYFSGQFGVAIYSLDGKLETENLMDIQGFTVGHSGDIGFPTPFFNNFVPVGEHIMRVIMKASDGKRYPLPAAYGNAESWKVIVTSGNPGTVTFSPIVPTVPNGIASVTADGVIRQTEYYTLDGIKVNTPVRGITIRRDTYSDGTVKVQKIRL